MRLALFLTLTCAAAAQEAPQGIDWAPDLKTAFERSTKDGRPVIAYFTFDT